MSISINPTISIGGPDTALISGTVSDPAGISNVEVFNGDTDLGPATLNGDGTWVFDALVEQSTVLGAVSTSTLGEVETSEPLKIRLGSPLFRQITSGLSNGTRSFFSVYGRRGRELYNGVASHSIMDVNHTGGPGVAFTYFSDFQETIENFRVAGPQHDTLNLADSGLHTLAQVLQHTTGGSSATIHINDQTSVTLQGVTKQQLAAHKEDFVFDGGRAPV